MQVEAGVRLGWRDAQIAKLLGTTKSTIESVRNRTHWNSANIKPVDPVTLGLVGQLALDEIVKKAADKKAKDDLKNGGGTIQPVEQVEESAVERIVADRRGDAVAGRSHFVEESGPDIADRRVAVDRHAEQALAVSIVMVRQEAAEACVDVGERDTGRRRFADVRKLLLGGFEPVRHGSVSSA